MPADGETGKMENEKMRGIAVPWKREEFVMKSIFFGLDERMNYVYTAEQKQWLAEHAGLLTTETVTKEMLLEAPGKYADVECVFSTWGTPDLTQEQVAEYLPNLKYLYYGAGSVQSFARRSRSFARSLTLSSFSLPPTPKSTFPTRR